MNILKKIFFLVCPDSWLHEIILFALIVIKVKGKKKAFLGKVMNNVSKVASTTALSNDELFSDPK